jgi:hypothetical protein
MQFPVKFKCKGPHFSCASCARQWWSKSTTIHATLKYAQTPHCPALQFKVSCPVCREVHSPAVENSAAEALQMADSPLQAVCGTLHPRGCKTCPFCNKTLLTVGHIATCMEWHVQCPYPTCNASRPRNYIHIHFAEHYVASTASTAAAAPVVPSSSLLTNPENAQLSGGPQVFSPVTFRAPRRRSRIYPSWYTEAVQQQVHTLGCIMYPSSSIRVSTADFVKAAHLVYAINAAAPQHLSSFDTSCVAAWPLLARVWLQQLAVQPTTSWLTALGANIVNTPVPTINPTVFPNLRFTQPPRLL